MIVHVTIALPPATWLVASMWARSLASGWVVWCMGARRTSWSKQLAWIMELNMRPVVRHRTLYPFARVRNSWH